MVVATPRRSEDGRLAAALPADVLVRLVREIAEEAARSWTGAILAPWEVNPSQWNTARLRWGTEHGIDVQEAKNVLRSLRNAFRDPTLSWPTLLAVIFFEETDPRRALAARAAHLRAAVTQEAADWSLNVVALNEGVCTFATIAAYDAARLGLIRSRRGPRRSLLLRYLVEGIDIARVCGGWVNALETAQLTPSPEMTIEIRRSTPITELQLIHFAETGAFGSITEVRELAKSLNTRMAALHGRDWHDYAEEARLLVLERGLPTPPPYGAPAPANWQRIPIDTNVRLVEPWQLPSRAEALHVVQRAQDWLPAGEPLTEAAYRAFEHDHPEAPSLKAIRKHGTIPELQAELAGLTATPKRQPRSTTPLKPQQLNEPSDPTPSRRGRPRQNHDDGESLVVNLLREHGPLRRAEVADTLGWPDSRANRVLKTLCDQGTVRMLNEIARSSKQSYDLASRKRQSQHPSPPPPPARQRETKPRAETLARDEMVLDLVAKEGDLSVAEIADTFGWRRKATNYAVSRLVEAGKLERTEAVLSSRNQRYRARRRRRPPKRG